MTDQELRDRAEKHLRDAFGLLSQHTHGEGDHAQCVSDAQVHIAAACVQIDQLNEMEQ